MSIDSRAKRASAVAVGFQPAAPSVQPDGSIAVYDRRIIAYGYSFDTETATPPTIDVPNIIGRIPVRQSTIGIVPTARTIIGRAKLSQIDLGGSV